MSSERGAAWRAPWLGGRILPRAKRDERSTAGRGGVPWPPQAGGSPSPHLSPRLPSPPQKPPTSFQFSAFPSWQGGWFPLTLDLQKELFLRHLPLVNRDFAGGSSSCINSCSSLLEMPLPLLQSPAFLPPSALLLAFFSLSFCFPQSQ